MDKEFSSRDIYNTVGALVNYLAGIIERVEALEKCGDPVERARIENDRPPAKASAREGESLRRMADGIIESRISGYKCDVRAADARLAAIRGDRRTVAEATAALKRAGQLIEKWDKWRAAVARRDRDLAVASIEQAEAILEQRKKQDDGARPVTRAEVLAMLERQGQDGADSPAAS